MSINLATGASKVGDWYFLVTSGTIRGCLDTRMASQCDNSARVNVINAVPCKGSEPVELGSPVSADINIFSISPATGQVGITLFGFYFAASTGLPDSAYNLGSAIYY